MPTVLVLGTATPGGGFPVYGDAFAATVNESGEGLEVQTRNTQGSTENVPLLESGQIDLGLVQGEVAHEAFQGVGRAPADLRIAAAMYSTAGMFVTRADSGVRSIEDLRGRPVAFGARGSGLSKTSIRCGTRSTRQSLTIASLDRSATPGQGYFNPASNISV